MLGIQQTGQQDSLGKALGSLALRSKIFDNRDEFLEGSPYSTFSDLPNMQAPTIRSQQEVEDLWLATIAALGCHGADLNNTKSILDIGLMPKFGKDSKGKGTFRPIPGLAFGIGLSDPQKTNAQLSRIKKDPLGAIFGSSRKKVDDRSTVQGAGDSQYGYSSDFGKTAGVGRPGYGDYGGNGYGSGQGREGDPGFKAPEKFSFLGVKGEYAAYSRFSKPTENNTIFGEAGTRVSLGGSNSGLSGGGATQIEGKPSAFSMVSTKGKFGEATAFASSGGGSAAAGVSAGVSAGPGRTINGVFVANASVSASAHAGFSLGHDGGENCPPPGISLTAGIGASVGF